MTATLNMADPRVTRTQQLLHNAYLALLSEKRIQDISVQDIAARATVNRTTFYAHYADKDALVEDIVRQKFRESLKRRLPDTQALTETDLSVLILMVFNFLKYMFDHCRPVDRQFDALLARIVQHEVCTVLVAGLNRTGTAPIEIVPNTITAQVSSWAIVGSGVEWGRNEHGAPVAEMAQLVQITLTQGLKDALRSAENNL